MTHNTIGQMRANTAKQNKPLHTAGSFHCFLDIAREFLRYGKHILVGKEGRRHGDDHVAAGEVE
jgi:hypothetical protein